MNIPTNIPVIESTTAVFWKDENDIVCVVTKILEKDISKDDRQRADDVFIEWAGNEKMLILIDSKRMQPSSPEQRKKSSLYLAQVTKALAIINYNPMGRMLINLFIGLQRPPYPVKVFKPDEVELAKEWLIKHK